MSAAEIPTPAFDSALDNPAWSSLIGAHASFAEGGDRVKRYPADMSPFLGVESGEDPAVWAELAELLGPGATVMLSHVDVALPDGWEQVGGGHGVQMVETDALETRTFDEAVVLGPDDVADMLALVERSRPGPFLPRTVEMGRYVGVRRGGVLVAMAGERLHPTGWTEISAVTTDDAHRRQGLASRLVLDVAHAIRSRGDRAMLHASETNQGAIAAYEKLGFRIRRRVPFRQLRTPA